MAKPFITVISLVLGSAAVALAVHIQRHPDALTSPVPPSLEKVAHRLEARATEVPRVMDEIRIVSVEQLPLEKPRRALHQRARPQTAARPCSGWWQIDPTTHVRMLCP